ncbi:hypothetical protein TWF281_003799 [Arthrobotrys megalospora]
MGRSSTSLSDEEWGRYKPLIEELLLVQGLTNKACCAYLKKYHNVNVDTRQLQYRVKEKWGHNRNLKASAGVQAFRTGLFEQPPEKWTQHEQKVREKMRRAAKRERVDLPSAARLPTGHANAIAEAAALDIGPERQAIQPEIQKPYSARSAESPTARLGWPEKISTQEICRDLTLQLRQGTAIPPAHHRNMEDFTMDGLILDDRRDSDLNYISEMIKQQDTCKSFQLVLRKVPYRPVSHGYHNHQGFNEGWNLEFVRAFIDNAIYLSNNNLLNTRRVKYLLWHLQKLPEFRSLLDWVLEKYPAATKGLLDLVLRHTIHAKEEPATLSLPTLISLTSSTPVTRGDNDIYQPHFQVTGTIIDEEREKNPGRNIVNDVLRNGKPWCLETLYEGNLLSESELEAALKVIITSPRILTTEAILKIHWLLQKGMHISALDKYSDANPEYQGWDLGTKLFLLTSCMRCNNKPAVDGPDLIFYDTLARHLLDKSITDYPKALINAIIPISYLRKKKKVRDLTTGAKYTTGDSSVNTRGPVLGQLCSYKGINYLLEKSVDINTRWANGKGKPYHVLTIALKHKRQDNVIRYLLDKGADFNTSCGNFLIISPSGASTTIPSTPLYEAIRSNVPANIYLILSKQPDISDPVLCLYLACRSRPLQASHIQRWKKGVIQPLREMFQRRRQELSPDVILHWDELNKCIVDGREGVLEQVILARGGETPIEVVVDALKGKSPNIFKMMLPPPSPGGSLATRKATLTQVLEKLRQDPKLDYLLCTHKKHKFQTMSAHRPMMLYALWEEIVDCEVLPPDDLGEKMIAPIFWSAIWEDLPERYKYQECLAKIVSFITAREMDLQEALREASTYLSTHLIDALCQPFEDQHRVCFESGVETALRLRLDLSSKTEEGLNVLHYAVAISAKAAAWLVKDGLLERMSRKSRSKLLVLSAHYGREDIVQALLENEDAEFVNITSTIEDFKLLTSAAVPRTIKGITTALHIATFHGRKDMIKLLLSKGADINMSVPRKSKGKAVCPEYKAMGTALVIAAGEGLSDIVDLLLQYKPAGLRLAARIASERGHVEIARTLERLCSPHLV